MSISVLLPRILILVLIQAGMSGLAVAENICQSDKVELQVLGSGGPEIDDGRASSSYIIWYQDKAKVIVDAGPGSSINFGLVEADFADLEAILLTHLHVDHSADLPAFVKGSYFSDRNKPLHVLGPAANALMPSTSVFLERLFGSEGAFVYLSDFLSGARGANFKISSIDVPLLRDKIHTYPISDDVSLQSIFVHHGPVAAVAWRVNIAGCSISFSGDMSNRYQALGKLAMGSDLLVINNAIPEKAQGIARNLHMPPSEIGKIAKQANVQKVLLSHFMKRTIHTQSQTLDIIGKFFDGNVILAEDLKRVSLNNLSKIE
ncbi:MAG: ribonuclease BN (tRNA processing enzyme) [Paraglaciecola sp.]|jgi:ribonuclease BN (tRNA processing enzyme)